MLNVVVFVCGAALMALELVASRVLAPALGNSIFVWGSVISVVMIALSLGYWLGGQLADKARAARALAPLVAGAGVLTVLVPIVAQAVLPFAADLGPRLGSLVASALIFFMPALLLATVSPLGVRLVASRGMAHIGRSAGGLYAISTGGSIVGTLATSFWLIPLLSLEPLIIAIGGLLFACSIAALALPSLYPDADHPLADERKVAVTRRVPVATSIAIALVVLGGVIGSFVLLNIAKVPTLDAKGQKILLRQDTQYHRVTVTELDGIRRLRFDSNDQTAIDMTDGYRSEFKYPNYADLALAVNPNAKRVLVLGLGGGAVPKRWWRDYPGMTIDAVEIDSGVVDISRKYFGLPEDERLRVVTQDARRFVQTTDDKYDVVFVDCYYADSLPFHLTTSEFFGEVKNVMKPDGVIAYNIVGSVSGERSQLFRSVYKTVADQWAHRWVYPIGIGDTGLTELNRNIIVVASNTDVAPAELARRTKTCVDGRVKLTEFPSFAVDLYTPHIPTDDVPILTDTYAPVDSLIKVQ